MRSMIRSFLFAAAILILAGPSCRPVDSREKPETHSDRPILKSQPLRVMSFNIRYGTAEDGENSWANRRRLVMKVIRENEPDLLGLQEALRFQLDEIGRAFPEYDEIGVGRDDGKAAGEFAAILYRRDRFEKLEADQFWLSESPTTPGSRSWGSACTRLCTWARLRDVTSVDSILFLNTHLDHFSEQARVNGARLILDRIRSLRRNEGVILCGDFNAPEDSAAIRAVLDLDNHLEMEDTFRSANSAPGDCGTFHGWSGTRSGSRIDYIFVAHLARPLTSASIIRLHEGNRYPSDHFPVIATFAPGSSN